MLKSKRDKIYSVLVDGQRYIVHTMYDIDGDETDDPMMAFRCTAQKGHTWLAIEVGRQGIQTE